MMPDDQNKLNRLEELKNKLFSKNYENRIEHRDVYPHYKKVDALDSWQTNTDSGPNISERFFMKTSLFKKFFIFSVVFFLLASFYGAYVFLAGGNTVSNGNIDIAVLGNNFTSGGDDLPLIVGITNKNNSPLDAVDLVVEYPKGVSTDMTADNEHFRISLGSIPSGAVRNENIKVVLFGEQGSVRPIKISIEYRVAGSNAIFIKDTTFNATISSTPINLSVDAPTTISPNQEIKLNVKATLNATKPAQKILVRMDYPVGFQFVSSIPAPSFGNNIWNLGDLAPGAEHDIVISGKMVDVFNGEEKTFNTSSGSQSGTDKSTIGVVFNSTKNTMTIARPFVAADIYINGVKSSTYSSDSKNNIDVEIHYQNNLDTKVNNLQIQAKVSGNALNRRTINVQQGFYDSAQDVINWDKNYQTKFKEVNPGDAGVVKFSFSPNSLFSADGGILKNPSINVQVNVTGDQALLGYASNQLTNSTVATINIVSDVGFSAKALYYSGPFINTGPIPPKVGKATTYTIVWSLSNTANSISKAVVHSTLPPWISFVGPVSPIDENLIYNPSTRDITWNADRVPRGTGITGTKKEVAFQVSFTPSLSQLHSTSVIINDAVLTGHDDFANVDVKVSRMGLNILLNSDPAFPPGAGQVVE